MNQMPNDTSEQPRRYRVRHLADARNLTERQIADELGISQSTVHRDLIETIGPAGHTEDGSPYYPPGRFDSDPEYVTEVNSLKADMPESNARRYVARKFSEAADRQRPQVSVDPERLALMQRFAEQHAT